MSSTETEEILEKDKQAVIDTKSMDFTDERLKDYAKDEGAGNENVRLMKRSIRFLPEVLDSFIPDVSGMTFEEPDAIFIQELKKSYIERLRISEASIQQFYKDCGTGKHEGWDADHSIKAMEKLMDAMSIIVESDNYYRDAWFNFFTLICRVYDNLKAETYADTKQDFLTLAIAERNLEGLRFKAKHIENHTGKKVKVTKVKGKYKIQEDKE